MTQPAQVSPVFPPDRYGHRRDPRAQRRRRYVAYLLAVVVAVGALATTVRLYRQYGNSPYEASNIVTTSLENTSLTVAFDLARPAGQAAVCTVAGHTRDGLEVGRAEVPVPVGDPGATTVHVTYTLATTQRAMTGEVPGCSPA